MRTEPRNKRRTGGQIKLTRFFNIVKKSLSLYFFVCILQKECYNEGSWLKTIVKIAEADDMLEWIFL